MLTEKTKRFQSTDSLYIRNLTENDYSTAVYWSGLNTRLLPPIVFNPILSEIVFRNRQHNFIWLSVSRTRADAESLLQILFTRRALKSISTRVPQTRFNDFIIYLYTTSIYIYAALRGLLQQVFITVYAVKRFIPLPPTFTIVLGRRMYKPAGSLYGVIFFSLSSIKYAVPSLFIFLITTFYRPIFSREK